MPMAHSSIGPRLPGKHTVHLKCYESPRDAGVLVRSLLGPSLWHFARENNLERRSQ